MSAREEELDAQLDAAERRIAELTDRIAEIADDALGLQVPGTPLLVMLGSLSKAIHDERILRSAAEAKLEAIMARVEEAVGAEVADCPLTHEAALAALDAATTARERNRACEFGCDCGGCLARDHDRRTVADLRTRVERETIAAVVAWLRASPCDLPAWWCDDTVFAVAQQLADGKCPLRPQASPVERVRKI